MKRSSERYGEVATAELLRKLRASEAKAVTIDHGQVGSKNPETQPTERDDQ